MPRVKIALLAGMLFSSTLFTGCAATSDPGYGDERVSQVRCPRHHKLKCIERTAAPDECSCVPDGDIEQTIESIIGIN